MPAGGKAGRAAVTAAWAARQARSGQLWRRWSGKGFIYTCKETAIQSLIPSLHTDPDMYIDIIQRKATAGLGEQAARLDAIQNGMAELTSKWATCK